MIEYNQLMWIFLGVTWVANINDLIRGKWFFQSWEAVVFWNFLGILALIVIILGYKNEIKELNLAKTKLNEDTPKN